VLEDPELYISFGVRITVEFHVDTELFGVAVRPHVGNAEGAMVFEPNRLPNPAIVEVKARRARERIVHPALLAVRHPTVLVAPVRDIGDSNDEFVVSG
jgi:hypothetical protein